eukprot:gene8102-12563_t
MTSHKRKKITKSLSEIPSDTLAHIIQFCPKKTLKKFIFTNKEVYNAFHELRKEHLEVVRLWYLNKKPFERKIDGKLIEPFKLYQPSPFPKIPNFQEFLKYFNKFCRPDGIGKYLIDVAFEMNKKMKQKLVVAGGALFSVLRKRDHFLDENDEESIPSRPPADIDIFLIENGCDSSESEEIIKTWFLKVEEEYFKDHPQNAINVKKEFEALKKANLEVETDDDIFVSVDDRNEFIICRDINNTISIIPYDSRKIQIILRKISSIEQLLVFFDLDCVRFAFDGEKLYSTREGIRSFIINKNIVPNLHKYNGMYFERSIQYGNRGIDTTFFNLHPLEHLDENFKQTKYLPLKMAHESRNKEDGEGYYVVSPTLEYWQFLSMYFTHDYKLHGYTFEGSLCLSFSELFKQNAEKCFVEEYRDNHLFNKYLISRCYICGKYQQLCYPYYKDCLDESESEDDETIDDSGDEVGGFIPDLKKDSFCVDCFKFNEKFKNVSRDLSGKTAIVTGGRIKIGFAVALKLLRSNCFVIVTTRFPTDAFERYQEEKGKFSSTKLLDFDSFKDRLQIYPLDLKNTDLLLQFTTFINKNHKKIDFLINNAAQTVRRPLFFYSKLIKKEGDSKMIKDGKNVEKASNKLIISGENLIQKSLEVTKSNEIPNQEENLFIDLENHDKFGEPVDFREKNSWNSTLDELNPIEIMEVQMINNIAPTLLISNLINVMSKRTNDSTDGYSHIINVTSDEGQFETNYKSKYHSHTNISKAALNMLTRTSSSLYAQQGILMNSVDPGWVSSMVPSYKKPILDCEDGAARILNPILSDYQKYGKLLKNFKEIQW